MGSCCDYPHEVFFLEYLTKVVDVIKLHLVLFSLAAQLLSSPFDDEINCNDICHDAVYVNKKLSLLIFSEFHVNKKYLNRRQWDKGSE